MSSSYLRKIMILERTKKELTAALPNTLHNAYNKIDKALIGNLREGVVLELNIPGPGGREVFEPVLIRDGLSPETIECLKKDMKRSSEHFKEFLI